MAIDKKKIYRIDRNTYFLITLSVLDIFVIGEIITEENGQYKYDSKMFPSEFLKDKPLVEVSHQIHAKVASHAISTKVNELVDRYL